MTSPDVPASPEPLRARSAVSAGIAAYLLLQLAVPILCYLAPDAVDERFQWRMFSSRQYERASCTIVIDESGEAQAPRRFELHRALSAASVRALGRHPERVGEALLRARCAASAETRAVRLRRTCHRADRGSSPAGEMELVCATGALSRVDL